MDSLSLCVILGVLAVYPILDVSEPMRASESLH
jgi:hypothetical protein